MTVIPLTPHPRIENAHWEDTGCAASPSCLSCPLPQCKYDDPYWYDRYINTVPIKVEPYTGNRVLRDQQRMLTMSTEGLSNEEAATRFGITLRTVFRIKRRVNEVPYMPSNYLSNIIDWRQQWRWFGMPDRTIGGSQAENRLFFLTLLKWPELFVSSQGTLSRN